MSDQGLTDRVRSRLRWWRNRLPLTPPALRAALTDLRPLPAKPADPDLVVREGLRWLLTAQAESASRDGGVARHYSLISGWGASYPETTGYIVPTLLECAESMRAPELEGAAIRMLDFLERIQTPDGGWLGGMVGQTPQKPVAFNTGQILMGMAAGAARDPRYRASMERGADWLVRTQDPDGAWRQYVSPFVVPGDKVYDTHIAWGLLEAARVSGQERFAVAARTNIDWAIAHQNPNGWFRDCCLTRKEQPLSHTIGYALRGILEGYRYFRDEAMLRAALLTCDALGDVMGPDGFIPGRLDSQWRPAAGSACLTGTSQIALCWLIAYEETGGARYRELASRANAYVRRTVAVDGPAWLRGGVKGSHPVWGDYGRYQLLNWACKFTVDANLLEQRVSALPAAKGAPSVSARRVRQDERRPAGSR